MSERVSALEYVFAIGKVRSLEKFLVKPEVFREAAQADLATALRIFADAGAYPEELQKITRSQELELVLGQRLSALYQLIETLLVEKRLSRLMRIDSCQEAEKLLSRVRGRLLQDYLKHRIDLHNIKTFLRLKILGEPLVQLAQRVSCAGFIPRTQLLRLYPQGMTEFIRSLARVRSSEAEFIDYASCLKEPIQEISEKKSFVAYERAEADFLARHLRQAKFFNFGPEPLIAYFFAKSSEIALIRMVILAKLNDLDPQTVKERLAVTYA